jgi:hypothetical protein
LSSAALAAFSVAYPGVGQAVAQSSVTTTRTANTQAATDLYWVQVGVFRDLDAARRVARRLRERKYPVQESTQPARTQGAGAPGSDTSPAPGSGDRYEIVIAGRGTDDLARKVSAKGLASRGTADGVVITPSLPLSEAVTLSRELGDDGLAVRVRRVATPAAPTAGQRPAGAGNAVGDAGPLHRVRVGGFADRAAAQAVLRELEGLGYKPFLARGAE